jgi:NADH-quinone oxidoreductase subunit A
MVPQELYLDYLFVLVFLLAGLAFALLPVLLAYLVTPRGKGLSKLITYESGIVPRGQAWIQFGVSYYLFALIFLAFDVDVLYLFPVLTVFGGPGWSDLAAVAIFLGIIALAIVYAWRKGVFEW